MVNPVPEFGHRRGCFHVAARPRIEEHPRRLLPRTQRSTDGQTGGTPADPIAARFLAALAG